MDIMDKLTLDNDIIIINEKSFTLLNCVNDKLHLVMYGKKYFKELK